MNVSLVFSPYGLREEDLSGGSSSQEPETSVSADSSISGQLEVTNSLLIGVILFLGVIVGAICMGHFWNRFRH